MNSIENTAKEDPRSIEFPCLLVRQPIGEFFVGVIPFRDLCDVADFDVRRVLRDQRDVERYLGIQRPLNDSRVRDLTSYVEYFDATFPTSVILAVEQSCAFYNDKNQRMILSNYIDDEESERILFRNVARVLDGQHRIASLFDYKGEHFDVIVSLFVGIDIADQAQIFSTVNLEQTKVNKSLAYDLFALAKTRSPQKTCHNVAVALDQDPKSPFHKRIKRLGVATEGRHGETITQATFVESLMRYVSRDPRGDRDALLRGKRLASATEAELQQLPFRNLFVDDRDLDIADIVFNYFCAIRERWPDAWSSIERGLMLNKTNGFRAFMRVLGPLYLELSEPGAITPVRDFGRVLKISDLQDQDFTVENFVPGTGGESELYRTLMRQLDLEKQVSLPL